MCASAAARARNVGKIFCATDGLALSFMQLMDVFGQRVGRRTPLQLRLFSRHVAKLIVREEHRQQAKLPMRFRTPTPRVPSWKPKFPDYREGLDQVIDAWGN